MDWDCDWHRGKLDYCWTGMLRQLMWHCDWCYCAVGGVGGFSVYDDGTGGYYYYYAFDDVFGDFYYCYY